jgi:two-component system, OmpR family, response regulator
MFFNTNGLECVLVLYRSVCMPRPRSVLIVDDEQHVRAYLKALLTQAGIKTFWEADDGEKALVVARKEKPELVVLDINMPNASGTEVLPRFKAEFPNLPVIMVTAENAMGTVLKCNELSADGYILKQQPKEVFLEMLTDALDALDNVAES